MKILFAGGGTAGHINPALAVAQKIKEKFSDADIRFAGVEDKIECRLIPQAGYKLYTVKLHGIRRKLSLKSLAQNIAILSEIAQSKKKMLEILKQFMPDVVVGMGGYAAYPSVAAAKKLGIPVVLMEVNALPGVTTKVLAAKADKILVNFDATSKRLGNRPNIVKTGIPVRNGIVCPDRAVAKARLGFSDKPLIVSFWGSLGASKMNKITADFMKIGDSKHGFYHIHASGVAGYKQMLHSIATNGINLKQNPFIQIREYISNMEELIAAADIVICRAGASTLAEISAAGRVAIIIPSPNVAENHQEINARALQDLGAACMILEKDCTGQVLYDKVTQLLADEQLRAKMENNAQKTAVLNASEKICDVISEIAEKRYV